MNIICEYVTIAIVISLPVLLPLLLVKLAVWGSKKTIP